MRRQLTIWLAGCICLLPIGAAAEAALVRVERVVLRADGNYSPRTLPRRSYAPVSFQGHADISSTDSEPPPALRQVRLDFDPDGRLTAVGLAVCPPSRIEAASPREARRGCREAIVGRGRVEAVVALPGAAPVTVRSPLTLFNGPRRGTDPTIVAHARSTFPAVETYVVVAPVERRGARRFGYRASFDVPEIASGFGALTHAELKIGRRYRSRGVGRSYTSARCPDGIVRTRGRFSFADGTIIAGSLFKPCNARP